MYIALYFIVPKVFKTVFVVDLVKVPDSQSLNPFTPFYYFLGGFAVRMLLGTICIVK
jgi:hypothetical protein